MKLYALTLLALLAPLSPAQGEGELTDRLTPPDEAGWARIQEQPEPETPRVTDDPALLRFYEVSDCVAASLGLPGPQTREARLEAGEDMETIVGQDQARAQETARLAELLARFVRPPLEGEQKIEGSGGPGVVIALATAAQHDWIVTVLNSLRAGARHYVVQATYMEAPRGAFREHVAEGTAVVLASSEEREVFLALADRPDFELLKAPELLVRDLQHGNLAVIEEIPYISKYELVVVQPGAQEIADPVIETLQEGYSLDVRALRLPEDRLGLELALTRAWVDRPIPTRKIRLSAAIDAEVTVSSPTSHRTDVRSHLVLAPGASVVFLTPSNTEGRDLAVVVSVRAIETPR